MVAILEITKTKKSKTAGNADTFSALAKTGVEILYYISFYKATSDNNSSSIIPI
ncbi:hypothetical protein [Aquimarina celericrescens]|uniref:Uncharacterized protein n=1 Tax=Aquimarina celericrescens TaxID=1964542 RepID=A0ABW5AZA2_9FLAO|nr:hypothetical protein [Aquimarina celericrescens]